MKKILTTALLLIAATISWAQTAKIHTAFTDVDSIKQYLQHASADANLKPNTSDKAIASIVIAYFKDRNVDLSKEVANNFGPRIARVVQKVLNNHDYVAIGKYIDSNFTAIQNLTRTPYATYHDSFTKYISNLAARQPIADSLQKFIGDGQKIIDQADKLASLKKVDADVISASALADTVLGKATVMKLLSATSFKDEPSLAAAIVKLTAYQNYYHQYQALNQAITATEHIIWQLFKLNDQFYAGYFTSAQSNTAQAVLNDSYIASNIGVVPQPTVFLEADKTIPASNDNNLETKIADALAILLIEHAKQDLLLMFFQKLRAEVARQPLLLDMFPHTYALLGEYPIYELPKFGTLWSHAIAEDLVALPQDIAQGKYVASRTEITGSQEFLLFNDIINIAGRVKMKTTFSSMVNYYSANPDELKNPYINWAFITLKMVYQECVKLKDGKPALLTAADLESYTDDDIQMMLGMLASKYPAVFKNFIHPFTASDASQLNQLRKYLVNILMIINNFNTAIPGVAANKTGDGIKSPFWDTMRELLNTLETTDLIKPDSHIKQYLAIAGTCLGIYDDAEQKNYSAMVHESLGLIADLLPEKYSTAVLLIKTWKLDKDKAAAVFAQMTAYFNQIDIIINKTEHAASDIAQLADLAGRVYQVPGAADLLVYSTVAEFKAELLDLYNRALHSSLANNSAKNTFIYSLSRIGQFWSDVEAAKNSTDLANVIQTYAVQPSSYLIKRNTRASISFNAHLGTYAGLEYAPAPKPVFGLSAPIGLSFNWGFHQSTDQVNEATFIGRDGRKKMLTGSCFSLNFSIVDIGAVASYRINNGNEGPLPKNFNFGQLLAPGLTIGYSIKGIPLMISMGAELTPELRSLATDPQPQPAIRLFAGLFYDLPFHTFSMR